MGRSDSHEIVARLGQVTAVEVGSEEVGREVEEKVNAICSRARRGERWLDASEALGHHVRLVLDNDEGSYRAVRELVGDHRAATVVCPFCDGSGFTSALIARGGDGNRTCDHCTEGRRPRSIERLGEEIKEYVERLAGLWGAGEADTNGIIRGEWGGPFELDVMAREILSTALAWVDWIGIAAIYLSETEGTEDGAAVGLRRAA